MIFKYHFSVKNYFIACACQIFFAAAEVREYGFYLDMYGLEGNLREYLMFSFNHPPFLCLAGTISVLAVMRSRSGNDILPTIRFHRRARYYHQRLFDGLKTVLLWEAAALLIRLLVSRAAGWRITGEFAYYSWLNGYKSWELWMTAAVLMAGCACYLTAVVWLREIVQDYTSNNVLRILVPVMFSVAELAVCKSMNYRILSFLPLGNTIILNAGIAAVPGRLAYWAFLMYALYYVKTEIAAGREWNNEWIKH